MWHRRGSAFGVGLAASLALATALQAAKVAAPKQIDVDCGKGESVQAAISASSESVEIVLHGFCAEHVVIDRGGMKLRGATGDPEVDGLTGLRPDGTSVDLGGSLGLVLVEGVDAGGAKSSPVPETLPVYLESLGIVESPAQGLTVVGGSSVGLRNVRVAGSAGTGVYYTAASFGVIDRLASVENGGVGLQVNRESLVNCGSCSLVDNGSWGVVGSNNGIVDLYDSGAGPSVVSGWGGARTWREGRIFLEGGAQVTSTVSRAIWATLGGAIEVYGAIVDGPIWCGLDGHFYAVDLEQRSNFGSNNFYSQCVVHLEDGEISFAGDTSFHTHATGGWFGGTSLSFDTLSCGPGGDFVCYDPVGKASSTCGNCP